MMQRQLGAWGNGALVSDQEAPNNPVFKGPSKSNQTNLNAACRRNI